MADNNLTEVVFILDRSGSMGGLEEDTIGGFNSMLDKQRKDTSKVLISTILFDHEIKIVHDRVPIAEVQNMTEKDYEVRGTTALLDAMGETINHIKKIHKYVRDEDRPARTMFIITTDGYENASYRYSYADIRNLVEAQKETGWEFVFLGANIDAIGTASRFGIDHNRAMNFHSDHIGTQKAYETFGNLMCCFAAAKPITDDWSDEIRRDFMGRSKGANM